MTYLSFKNDVNVLSIINKQKKIIVIGILKVNDENIRIRIHFLKARIPGSGSVPKYHGSATLLSMSE
jgi:hypothetical protein